MTASLFYRDAGWFEAMVLPRPLTWRERIAGWLILMAQRLVGFDSDEAFDRCRQTIIRSERDVGTNRVPRGEGPTGGDFDFYIGKTSGAISKGSTSGTVTIWDSSTNAAGLAASSSTLTNVYNPFADVADVKWVLVIQMPWAVMLCAAEC
jgi:hypothetical protein